MEHRGMRLAAVSLYIIILSVHMKWNLFVLFDIQMVFFVFTGTTIYVCFDCRENPTLKKVVASAKESLYPVGMLCSFLLIFYQCYNTGTADLSFSELAMNLRPLFYTVLTSFILDKKENVLSSDKKPPYNKADTERQIYFYLKEQGFTEREIEVTIYLNLLYLLRINPAARRTRRPSSFPSQATSHSVLPAPLIFWGRLCLHSYVALPLSHL